MTTGIPGMKKGRQLDQIIIRNVRITPLPGHDFS